MFDYLNLLKEIFYNGVETENRTGIKTHMLWGEKLQFDLSTGLFPLVTTKKIHFKSVVTELLFFIKGYTDVRWLQERKCRIWNEWATKEQCAKRGMEEFDLGPVYGWQWRHFGATYRGMKNDHEDSISYFGEGFDQLLWAQNELRTNPNNRQIIISAWDALQRPLQALPPCHCMIHFRAIDGHLNSLLVQRSCDMFLGVPFNIASYALFTLMMAQTTGLKPGKFVHILNDAHIYYNHFKQCDIQLSRYPRDLPKVKLNPLIRCITDFQSADIRLENYNPYPSIKAEVAV